VCFGGVYSNLHALQALKQQCEHQHIPSSNILFTGDSVAYCAHPVECVEMLQSWGLHAIAGNVEVQLRNNEDYCGCNFSEDSRCDLFSRQWYPFIKKNLSQKDLDWFRTLPDIILAKYGKYSIAMLHGSLSNNAAFVFKSTDKAIKSAMMKELEVDVVIAGHCGLPFIDEIEDGIWFNPGVIGMPANDGTTEVWYGSLHLDEAGLIQCTHHRLKYDHLGAAKAMDEIAALPKSYMKTLNTGIWDNCDILPETETKAQGKRIEFM
jgi:predicted phosphodiesterase